LGLLDKKWPELNVRLAPDALTYYDRGPHQFDRFDCAADRIERDSGIGNMARAAHLTTKGQASGNTAIGIRRLWPVFFAALLGVSLIYGVGLASPSALHNAAHDSRHSLSFPCH